MKEVVRASDASVGVTLPKKVLVTSIQDRSGSMASVWEEALRAAGMSREPMPPEPNKPKRWGRV